jgi:hypothetical protein
MSFELDGTLVLLLLLVPAGLFVALATAPRWAARSMSKHAMWNLRDDVVDDTLTGRLPTDHVAVRELIERTEWAIRETRSLDFLHFFFWTRARRKIPRELARKLAKSIPLDGLHPDQAERVRRYRTRYNTVAIRGILLSSWIGMLVILRFTVPAIREVVRARQRSLGSFTWTATNSVVSETDIGERAREFVTDNGPEREPALV